MSKESNQPKTTPRRLSDPSPIDIADTSTFDNRKRLQNASFTIAQPDGLIMLLPDGNFDNALVFDRQFEPSEITASNLTVAFNSIDLRMQRNRPWRVFLTSNHGVRLVSVDRGLVINWTNKTPTILNTSVGANAGSGFATTVGFAESIFPVIVDRYEGTLITINSADVSGGALFGLSISYGS